MTVSASALRDEREESLAGAGLHKGAHDKMRPRGPVGGESGGTDSKGLLLRFLERFSSVYYVWVVFNGV